MNDQPTNQGDQPPADQNDGHTRVATDHDQPLGRIDQNPTNQPTTAAWLSLEEAASVLGISENAVRQRIKRGTVLGVKSDAGWFVDVSRRPTTDQPPVSATIGYHRPTNQAPRPTDHRPTIDLVPLTELIDDLTRRNADLAAAAAMWQTRAAHLENELKQLTAGAPEPTEDAPESPDLAPGSPESDDGTPTGIWTWIKRVLGG